VVTADQARISSAARASSTLAPAEIASAFGLSLANSDGVTVTVKDSAGVSRPAQIYFVSASQVNFVIPAETALGTASITIHSSTGPDVVLSAEIRSVAPTLFTADASGTGVAAATAIRVTVGGQFPLPVFTCAGSVCSAVPMPLGVDTPIYVSFYGTGIRNGRSFTCTIGGISVPVLYAGPQGQYAGLDQVNVPLTLNLRGIGETDVIVTVDGQPSNPVRINVQ
jgi:uncharacterized protein (TIGR03437 family)